MRSSRGKKLSLARETVRVLTNNDLKTAIGGTATAPSRKFVLRFPPPQPSHTCPDPGTIIKG